ncbi:hypothetical protein OG413_02245 [Streptomyces sp. NBC_01433]|uniref:hypothetical protein n=1 Tax=Streptomyces sp. NBC_01433 TaxID=2903864 RepID=UPI00224D0A24|nr:hypothetical protein [Streptomyces sp. NBC_01433]MCX4674147.1 hypothetical protein [Streptomyces sp. NBC_01433]
MAVDEPTVSQDSSTDESWIFSAPPEKAQRAEAARKELEAMGAEVRAEAKWWGFQLILNQQAVDAYLEIKDLIADILGEVVKEPLSSLVAVAAMAQKVWVEAVSRGYGCKLVSPWISPLMLIPVGLGPKEDLSLWWTVFETGQGWSVDERFTDHQSGSNPALANFNGRLVCVHRGGNDNFLWYTEYDPAKGWTRDTRMGGQRSSHGVALAVHNGVLHCVYKAHNDAQLWTTSFNGSRWTDGQMVPSRLSSHGPGLASHGGDLHLVHRSHNNNHLWHSTWDSAAGWSSDQQMPSHQTASNPALVSWDGKLRLVHRGGNDTSLWHSVWEAGKGWGPDHQLNSTQSLEGPALAVFQNDLYVIHRGSGSSDQNLWWTKCNKAGSWTPDTKFSASGHLSGAGPAVVVYRDPKNGTRDQLLVVHRGWGNRAAGTDAAEVEAQLTAEQAANATQNDTP